MSLTFPVSLLILSAGEVQAFYEDLSGRQYVNEVFNFSVDKLYDLLFTDSPFQRDFMEQRRFSGPSLPGLVPPTPSRSVPSPFLSSQAPSFSRPPAGAPPLWPHAVPELLGALRATPPRATTAVRSPVAPRPLVPGPKGSAVNRIRQGSPSGRE